MHANVMNNKIIDFNSNYLDEDITRVETTQEMYDLYMEDNRAVIFSDGEIIENTEYSDLLAEEERLKNIEDIKSQLRELDLKSIRAIRANDTDYLVEYEEQAQKLRDKLSEL